MKRLELTFLAAAIFFTVAPVLSQENGDAGDKSAKRCEVKDNSGHIIAYGTYCFTGTSKCVENPC